MFDTEILIVGAGPTGLMMACQLQRFNIPFRIIDNNPDRMHESRAFGIQARTMEIFQNLGLADEFLKRAEAGLHARLYIKGKERLTINFKNLSIEGTPFPTIYFLPQNVTEEILINYLTKQNVSIERNTELTHFLQTQECIEAEIKNNLTNEAKKITCQYIVGCDGAHSKVRKILNVEFEGASYKQEFILADGEVDWGFPKDNSVRVFFSEPGVFGDIPFPNQVDRILAAKSHASEKNTLLPSREEIETLGKEVTGRTVTMKNMIWSSRFHLHHRAVKNYQIDRAFIAGDAAHIHTPVGGQGMNTGLQDVTNLAWKLAFVIRYQTSKELLETYQTERHYIGQVLVRTTDRIFGFMTSQNFFLKLFRLTFLPKIMEYINKKGTLQRRMFLFMSQLKIRYYKSKFVIEAVSNADKKFLKTIEAGCRAPDANYQNETLFNIFKKTPCTILIFNNPNNRVGDGQEEKLNQLKVNSKNLITILNIDYSQETQIIFNRYGVSSEAIYFIRPDGYIGFRSFGLQIDHLLDYLKILFPRLI